MNSYQAPAEYQLSEEFELPSVRRPGYSSRWAAAAVAVAIIFGATIALVAAAETAIP